MLLKIQKKIIKGEQLLLNIGTLATKANVIAVKTTEVKTLIRLELGIPTCFELGDKIAISRRVNSHWRLICWAKIVHGLPCERMTVKDKKV